MAADVKRAKIFTNSNGSAVIFFMRPCAERQTIRPLINEHGGKVTSNSVPGCIKLAEKGSTVTEDGYISTRFLKECVKQNKMVDVNDFRIKPGTTAPGDSDLEDMESDYSLSPADEIKQRPVIEIKGRNKYTKEEDIAIIRHLITENVYNNAHGLKIWKQMEFLKVTSHTAQSMHTRYRKIILPNIQQYAKDIDRSWISKLTGVIVPPSNTSFDVEDLFKRKSLRTQDNKETSPSKASSNQASSKSGKKLYKQLEFVELDKKKIDEEKISKYFSCLSKDTNNAQEVNKKIVDNVANVNFSPGTYIMFSHKDTEKSPQKRLTLRIKNQNVTNLKRDTKGRNDSDIPQNIKNTDKSPLRTLRDKAHDRNETNTRSDITERSVAGKAKRRNNSDSDCNMVTSSIEDMETNIVNSESERQNSEEYHRIINLKRKNNVDYSVSDVKQRTLRSNVTQQNKDLSVDEKKRKRSDEIISSSMEDRTNHQKKVKRLDRGPQGDEVHNESLIMNTDTIVIDSQNDTPDTDVVHDTPDDHKIEDETGNTKRITCKLHITNKKRPESGKAEFPVDSTKQTSTTAGRTYDNIDDTSVEEIINSIDDVLDSQTETNDSIVQHMPDSVEFVDETIDPGNDCSQGSSPLLKIGPQTSTPKTSKIDDDGIIELDMDSVEDCRVICKGIAERYDLQYETVRLLLYGCNGNIRRALSYINFGPHSFYPLPWSVKDDELLEDHRNVPSLIVKYGAKEVQDRLLFLEELL